MRHGFSLVELSIVLVILGLLTGGILAGQSLIRASEIRAVATETSRHIAAIHAFRDKYLAQPGDLANATSFWGSMTNCGVASPSGTGTQTCNGNADGSIGQPAAASQTGERFNYWQHLANAGLIEGNYTGIAGAGGVNHSLIGINSPASRISTVGWGVGSVTGYYAGNTISFSGDYGTRLNVGTQTSDGFSNGPFLKPEEAWNIDTKIDDGRPGRGRVLPSYWDDCTTATSETQLDADYLLTEANKVCGLYVLRVQ